ncbi:MAG: methionine--tRNA ligase [Desulfurococcales archaeon]|nr:methionine--tRNA ligase [Desulfurococcales archaeon]
MEAFYVTTPIYYPNAPPHIGHAYTTVYADVLARYHRLRGVDTFYLTGTDEHGLKLQRAAERLGKHPKELVDEMAEVYRRYWAMLDISYDRFIRTTDPDHEELVRWVLGEMRRKGLIYKASYSGWYCVDCEKFYSEGEYIVVDGRPYCPIHRKPLEWLEEETYYFKLSEFEGHLRRVLPGRVYPDFYASEVLGKIEKEGLRDISISRPRERVWWGIPIPWDPSHTTYVWFDALLNYLTGAGFLRDKQRFRRLWSGVHHVIGKDILWFHTVVWFSMLEALEVPPPRKVVVHGFLINRGLKMGKSAGNVISIEALLERYHTSDGVRYVLMRVFNLGKDVDVSTELFDSIYNSELADNYGNLVRRVATLALRKLGGRVDSAGVDSRLERAAARAAERFTEHMDRLDVSPALQAAMDLLREANAYVNETRPWEKGEPVEELYTLLEAIRVATSMLQVVIPRAASAASEALGFDLAAPGSVEGAPEAYLVRDAPILFRKVR